MLLVLCNFTPEARSQYRIGVPFAGTWKELFNSDDSNFGGSGALNSGLLYSMPDKYHGKDNSILLTLPPLGCLVLKLNEEVENFK